MPNNTLFYFYSKKINVTLNCQMTMREKQYLLTT